MPNNTQPQLPDEVMEEIKQFAKTKRVEMDREIKEGVTEESRFHFLSGYEEGLKSGATEWAIKLHQVKQDLAKSKELALEWLKASRQNIEFRYLLEKFISRHEAGLLPDRFIYDEIKTFIK